MSQGTQESVRWTTADLEVLPENEGTRYEIIDGELFVTRSPHWNHQKVILKLGRVLDAWSEETGLGQASPGAGVLFSESDNVIPDLVWVSRERFALLLDEAGHLTGAPELVVEVLSAGAANERRDREAKLKLYSTRGVQEYWIVDWQTQQLEVYRRENARLVLVATLLSGDQLSSPLLPGFHCSIDRLFNP
jgi:Uma2 family endonuclease